MWNFITEIKTIDDAERELNNRNYDKIVNFKKNKDDDSRIRAYKKGMKAANKDDDSRIRAYKKGLAAADKEDLKKRTSKTFKQGYESEREHLNPSLKVIKKSANEQMFTTHLKDIDLHKTATLVAALTAGAGAVHLARKFYKAKHHKEE
jgi:hypothetical protein